MALTRKIVLEATREEVWDKVSTGPGLSSWFVPHELESRKGGFGRADFGGGTFSEGRVLVYEPGRRIVLGSERIAHEVSAEPESDTSASLEFWIGGGDADQDDFPDAPFSGIGDVRGRRRRPGRPRTILHFRQRGFPEEGQEVFEAGWDVYFYTLTEYFRHFRGKTALTTTALAIPPMDRMEAFATVMRSLGVDQDADEGDRVALRPRGRQEQIEGVVDLRMSADHLEGFGLRNELGFLRVTADEACGVMLNRYEYVSNPPPDFASVRDLAGQWQGWLLEQYA